MAQVHPVISTLSRVFDMPSEFIGDELQLRAVDSWDELTAVELQVHLEHELGTTLDDHLIERIESVGQLRAFYDARLAELAGLPVPADVSALVPAPPATDPGPRDAAPVPDDAVEVVVGETGISEVDPVRGRLAYRGYPIQELIGRVTFEEVVHLLLRGWLPDAEELAALRSRLAAARALPAMVAANLTVNAASSPSAVLRTAVPALAVAADADADPADHIDLRERLIARIPTIFATQQAARAGRRLPEPRPDLTHAENILYMLGLPHDPERVRLVDLCLVLQAEHGCNASAFAARVAAGTGADTFATVTVALATFTGPLHGGAAHQVIDLASGDDNPQTAAAYLRGRADATAPRPVPYAEEDPRVRPLREAARRFRGGPGSDHVLDVLDAVRAAAHPSKGPRPYLTVDCYAAAIYHMLGMPSDLFVPMFAAARVAGWLAHVEEQRVQQGRIHPRLRYVGPRNLRHVPDQN
ncbi:citrate/2-methylcitrate synthase [Streptomyces sp. Li-HN-5-11]|uniref:citrate/2-methylcitrate synthase n=1 Tax=Streptomyces sp. Li-HN-5-11 TaxID=3075432 RepID=UPI0028AB5D67|nr:citrate/2-methylcitrate synthase [Streptomyces sp. Li-HN-5-11]WNM31291.1 citrate/2-methylcitrate synthase [Streptomyces sp. Li-HN-5-11]